MVLSALCWSIMCLDCSGQDLRKISEWEVDVPLSSDFAISHREPQRARFKVGENNELTVTCYYSSFTRVLTVKRLVYRFQKRDIGRGIAIPYQFLRQYLEWAVYKKQRLHINTNRELAVCLLQGPPYGYATIVDAFFFEYDVKLSDSIRSPRMAERKRSSAVGSESVASAVSTPTRQQAWTEPCYCAAEALKAVERSGVEEIDTGEVCDLLSTPAGKT